MTMLNRLSKETSPYLQQHATQPVEWYPWGDEALTKAKKENKPILLSIGYAACHWCHVMAHESFDDNDTAALMNELFINIKVDREERPDLDKIYQTAHYFLTQTQGGWPLTVFLAPDDLTPFFSGTYFPKERRYQLPAFKHILETIADIYKHHTNEVKQQNRRLLEVLNEESTLKTKEILSDKPFQIAKTFLEEKFDKQYGGFGTAPKFPHPPIIKLLLQEKSSMAYFSLLKMAEGGLYDQIEGGFFRYAVDEKWEIPHFEKMLYDNAQLLYLYALGSQLFHSAFFATVANETAEWVIRQMQNPQGGYYASIDADSEGTEGKYYIWNKFEIAEQLTKQEFQFAEYYFGLTSEPNFETAWHLHIQHSLEDSMKKMQLDYETAQKMLASIKSKLKLVRQKRIAPHIDTKIISSWNGLMIKSLLVAGHILNKKNYLDSAHHALHFIYTHLWKNNTLFVSYKDSRTSFPGYLDDYAFVLDAILTSLQISWDTAYLEWAVKLADNLITCFADSKGGFYFTSLDQERILFRPKTMMDEATPSGNAFAARALILLGRLLNKTDYTEAGERALKSVWPFLMHYPSEHANFLLALEEYLNPSEFIIVRGPTKELAVWQKQMPGYEFKIKAFFIPEDENILTSLAPHKQDGKTRAFICKGTSCLPEIDDINEFKKRLANFN